MSDRGEAGPRTRISEALGGPLGKALLIGLLVLVMLIPLVSVEEVIQERAGRYRSVVQEIAGLWGGPQRITGPLLAVPFEITKTGKEGRPITRLTSAIFLPVTYGVSATLLPSVRHRGLFESVVFAAELEIEGEFLPPPVESWNPGGGTVHWDRARLIFATSDPRSIGTGARLRIGDEAIALTPGLPARLNRGLPARALGPSLSAALPARALAPSRPTDGSGAEARRLPFSLSLQIRGSGSLEVLPLGRETEVAMASSWTSPSFQGAYLPNRMELGDEGFTADWSVAYYGRGFPQIWLASAPPPDIEAALSAAAFGVRLIQPVDAYRQAERTAKYGLLFVLYTFGALFLFEVLGRLRLHLVHYGLVGLSLCLFFLLLLSLAEHLGFAPAYGIAAGAVLVQIGLYTRGVVGSAGRSLLFIVLLAGLYGALYALMQLETHALLIGSIALFLLLAMVMAVARRIDWYATGPVSSDLERS